MRASMGAMVDNASEGHDQDTSREADGTQGAVVRFLGQRWILSDGDTVSVGRQSTCDIRVGSTEPGPEDLGVSRRAASLIHAGGRIWVRNESNSLPVFVRPAVGHGYVLERRGDTVSLSGSEVEVVLEGQIMAYRLTVQLPSGLNDGESDGPATVAPATRSTLPLTSRERKLLTALCEPLLTPSGRESRPASYREVADRLGLSDHTVRNALDALRERLISIGIPGMVGSDAKDNLAYYAVRSGSVTPADLALLARGTPEPDAG